MADATRLLTLLKLIRLLNSPTSYPITRLARRFNVHSRTIYRYIELLEEVGFQFEKEQNRYRIKTHSTNSSDLFPLLDVDEINLLKEAIFSIHEQHPKKAELLKKLQSLNDVDYISEIIIDEHKAHIYKLLVDAIKDKNQVILLNYYSQNSQTTKDRLIEPIGFTSNLSFLVAYDCELQSTRLFKPNRMDEVQILDKEFSLQAHHEWEKPDCFGMKGLPKCCVSLKMSPFALHLLEEEYPEMLSILPQIKNEWKEIQLNVQGFDGIGRFILGLPGEIEVLNPTELKMYLNERAGKKLW